MSGHDCDETSRQAPIRSRPTRQANYEGIAPDNRQINAKAQSQSNYGSDSQKQYSFILAVNLVQVQETCCLR